jgi:hypothetical protein
MIGSLGLTESATTQVVLTYSSNLDLPNRQNLYFKGITLDFGDSGSGLILTSSSYNRFEDVSIVRAGSTTQPALTINTSGSGGANNSVKNTFNNLNILCNQMSGENCEAGILLQGSTSNGNAVTWNSFVTVAISGAVNKGIDMEDESDSNHFYDVVVNQDLASPPSTACALCFNVGSNSGVDIDADGSSFENVIVGNFPHHIQAGVSYGNIISGTVDPGLVKPLSSKYPSFIFTHSVPGPGTTAAQLFLVGGHIGLSGPEGLGRNHDVAGACTLTSGTCGQINFNSAYLYTPTCVATWQSTGPKGVLSSNMTTTYIEPTSSISTDNGVVEWICFGNPY